jgi:hypothetical protein
VSSDQTARDPRPRRPGRAPRFEVVFRTGELVGYRRRICQSEFGRDPGTPPPRVCPRETCPTHGRAR